jgi:hypothetical protein
MLRRWMRYLQLAAYSPKIHHCHNRCASVLSANRSPEQYRLRLQKGSGDKGFEAGFTHNLTEGSGAPVRVQSAGQRVSRRAIPGRTQRHALLQSRDPAGRRKGFPCVVSPGPRALLLPLWRGAAERFYAFSTAFHRPHKQPPLCAHTCPRASGQPNPYPGAPRAWLLPACKGRVRPKNRNAFAGPPNLRPGLLEPDSLEPARDAT